MTLSPQQQCKKLLSTGERILFVLPENPSGDVIGASYGFAHTLTEQDYAITIAVDDNKHVREYFAFLPQPQAITSSLRGARDFILTFKTTHNDILDVATERDDDMLRIRVTPEKGMVDTRDFSFGLDTFPYDAIIAVGLHTKEDAGRIYRDAPDLFYEIPIINIDHHPTNEGYGHVNMITLTASSVSEIVTELARDITEQSLSPQAAECFLTGIIAATDSFRTPQTTPAALSLAAELIESGADQQKIITQLFKSQPLHLVRLWGRLLQNLHAVDDHTIIISTLTAEDFSQTTTGPHFLPQLLDKIKKTYADGKIYIILYEDDGQIKALIHTPHITLLPSELRTTTDSDTDTHEIAVDAPSLTEAEKKILRTLSRHMAQ